MFEKLVAIEPVSLIPSAEEKLHDYAKEVVLYRDIPADDEEIVRRIGDADAALLSYTSRMGKNVIERCPNLKYIGMCCSLYSEESANVDIAYARQHGIKVLGIRDYGDKGVVEYVLHELTGLLHGFGMPMLRDEPVEITGLKVGIVGLGVSGKMIADALAYLGADISYYSRTRKPEAEQQGMQYKPLARLLAESEVVFTCLNKNVLLLGREEFARLGAGAKAVPTLPIWSCALEAWLTSLWHLLFQNASQGSLLMGLYSQCLGTAFVQPKCWPTLENSGAGRVTPRFLCRFTAIRAECPSQTVKLRKNAFASCKTEANALFYSHSLTI